LQERFLFLAKNLPVVIIPVIIYHFTGDVIKGFLVSAFLFLLVLAGIHYRKFTHHTIPAD